MTTLQDPNLLADALRDRMHVEEQLAQHVIALKEREAQLQDAAHGKVSAEEALQHERAAHERTLAPFKAVGVEPPVVPALMEAFTRIGQLTDKVISSSTTL